MDYFPKPSVARFEQIKPGEIFFLEALDEKFVAIKATDNEQDGDKLMVLLGPTFPQSVTPGQLIPWRDETVISLGTNFTIRLPTTPDGWTTDTPPDEFLPLILREDGLHIRGKFNSFPAGPFRPCLVKISDGTVEYKHRQGIHAYCINWEIRITENDGTPHTVLRVGKGV